MKYYSELFAPIPDWSKSAFLQQWEPFFSVYNIKVYDALSVIIIVYCAEAAQTQKKHPLQRCIKES